MNAPPLFYFFCFVSFVCWVILAKNGASCTSTNVSHTSLALVLDNVENEMDRNNNQNDKKAHKKLDRCLDEQSRAQAARQRIRWNEIVPSNRNYICSQQPHYCGWKQYESITITTEKLWNRIAEGRPRRARTVFPTCRTILTTWKYTTIIWSMRQWLFVRILPFWRGTNYDTKKISLQFHHSMAKSSLSLPLEKVYAEILCKCKEQLDRKTSLKYSLCVAPLPSSLNFRILYPPRKSEDLKFK